MLIKGVDSLLTEIAWSNARPRTHLDKIRLAVDPDAVKGKLPFDESLLRKVRFLDHTTYSAGSR
jgi:hypothetical protein